MWIVATTLIIAARLHERLDFDNVLGEHVLAEVVREPVGVLVNENAQTVKGTSKDARAELGVLPDDGARSGDVLPEGVGVERALAELNTDIGTAGGILAEGAAAETIVADEGILGEKVTCS